MPEVYRFLGSNASLLRTDQALVMRKILDKATGYQQIYLDIDSEKKTGQLLLNVEEIPLKLVDLPTIVESYKTKDDVMYKTADISQMLVHNPNAYTSTNATNKQNEFWQHGLTPPLKNVRTKRFRKTTQNTLYEQMQDAKEIHRLLKQDSYAVKVRWELVDDEQKITEENKHEKNHEEKHEENFEETLEEKREFSDDFLKLFGSLSSASNE